MARAACLLASLLLLAACENAASTNDCPETCLCTTDGCPTDVCGVLVELADDCVGVEPRVELYFAGCVEEKDLVPGTPTVACGYVLAGENGSFVARGEGIQWGGSPTTPMSYECPEGGGLLFPITLHCTAQ